MPIDKNGLTQAEYLEKVAAYLGLTLDGLRLSMRVDTQDFQAWLMPRKALDTKRIPDPIHRLLEVLVELEDMRADRRDEAFSG